jgi:hypothetical protein
MWKIKYYRRCPEWHEQCSPYIVNEKDEKIVEIPCFVNHPGEFDAKALEIAETIVRAVNSIDPNEKWLEERGFQLIHRDDLEHWQFDLVYKDGEVAYQYIDMIKKWALMRAKEFVESLCDWEQVKDRDGHDCLRCKRCGIFAYHPSPSKRMCPNIAGDRGRLINYDV